MVHLSETSDHCNRAQLACLRLPWRASSGIFCCMASDWRGLAVDNVLMTLAPSHSRHGAELVRMCCMWPVNTCSA